MSSSRLLSISLQSLYTSRINFLISIADSASLCNLEARIEATAPIKSFCDKTSEYKKEPSDGSASTLSLISS